MTDTATTTKTSLNKFEKFKAEKDGLAVKEEIEKFASLGWEAMDETDRDHRLKWMGVFFRPVTPGKFMMRMRIPNGILTSNQMRVLAAVVQRYGDDGSADITTRQNLQLRGIRIEDLPDILNRLQTVGLTSVQSGMDNVRNITGDPVAGLDADELYDTQKLVQQIQDMLTNKGEGNPEFTNLPRKFNIAIAGGRDNSVHAEINDLAFVPAFKEAGEQEEKLPGGFPTPVQGSRKRSCQEGFQRQLLMAGREVARRVSNASCSWGKPPRPGGFPTPVAHGGNPQDREGFQRQLLMGETPKTALAPNASCSWGKPPRPHWLLPPVAHGGNPQDRTGSSKQTSMGETPKTALAPPSKLRGGKPPRPHWLLQANFGEQRSRGAKFVLCPFSAKSFRI